MKVSIIIPLYNKAPYVIKTLDSVLMQTYTDWECVVVNDGSTDESLRVVNDYCVAHNDERFKIITQPNAGVSAARNRGISVSHGEYVAFLDADDWWDPNYLTEMVQFAEEYPDAGIYGCNYYNFRRGKASVRLNYPTGYMDYFKVYADTDCMPLWTGAVMIKKNTVQEFDGFPVGMVLGEDTYLWMQVVIKYGMAWLNTPLTYYNNDVSQETRGVVNEKIYKPETFLTFHLDAFSEMEKNSQNVKRLFDKMRVYSLERYLEYGAYSDLVKNEITKVDWKNVSMKYYLMYNFPYPLVRIYFGCRKYVYKIYCKFRYK